MVPETLNALAVFDHNCDLPSPGKAGTSRLQWSRGEKTSYSSCKFLKLKGIQSQRGSEGESSARLQEWNKTPAKVWSWSREKGIEKKYHSKAKHTGAGLERFRRGWPYSQFLFIYSQPSSSLDISSLWHPIITWEPFGWNIIPYPTQFRFHQFGVASLHKDWSNSLYTAETITYLRPIFI